MKPFLVPTRSGMLIPPSKHRSLIKTIAHLVAINGPQFESGIRQSELGNSKYDFLYFDDPYHPYYQYKLMKNKKAKAQRANLNPSTSEDVNLTAEKSMDAGDPPDESELDASTPSVSPLDAYILKMTARLVVENEKLVENILKNKERFFKFDFLRPQNVLYPYFIRFVEIYRENPKDPVPPESCDVRHRRECCGTCYKCQILCGVYIDLQDAIYADVNDMEIDGELVMSVPGANRLEAFRTFFR